MCCCGKPVINGEMGYRWQPTDTPQVRLPNPPELGEGELIVFDEPGRCGGLDCHSHHFRVITEHFGGYALLVQHGGGLERVQLWCGFKLGIDGLKSLDTNARYWLLYGIYDADRKAKTNATDIEAAKWMQAAAGKRIKTRKYPKRRTVKVWIEDAKTPDTVCFTS